MVHDFYLQYVNKQLRTYDLDASNIGSLQSGVASATMQNPVCVEADSHLEIATET